MALRKALNPLKKGATLEKGRIHLHACFTSVLATPQDYTTRTVLHNISNVYHCFWLKWGVANFSQINSSQANMARQKSMVKNINNNKNNKN